MKMSSASRGVGAVEPCGDYSPVMRYMHMFLFLSSKSSDIYLMDESNWALKHRVVGDFFTDILDTSHI